MKYITLVLLAVYSVVITAMLAQVMRDQNLLKNKIALVQQCAAYAAERAVVADDRTSPRRKQDGVLELSPPKDRYNMLDAEDELAVAKCKL